MNSIKNNLFVNKLHFKEIDFVIYFPKSGNEGRFINKYGVSYRDRKEKKTQSGKRINLQEVLVLPKIKKRYPHTIGLFHKSSGKRNNWNPEYIKIMTIHNVKELIEWIKQIEDEK